MNQLDRSPRGSLHAGWDEERMRSSVERPPRTMEAPASINKKNVKKITRCFIRYEIECGPP